MRDSQPEWFSGDLGKLFSMLKQAKIKPRVFKRLPLENAAEAHRLIEAGKVEGKIVLEVFAH